MKFKKVALVIGALALSVSLFGGAIETEAATKKNAIGTTVISQTDYQLGKKGSKVHFQIAKEGSTLKNKRPNMGLYGKYVEIERQGFITNRVDVKLYNKTTKKFVSGKEGALSHTHTFFINPDQDYELRVVESDNSPSKIRFKVGYKVK